LSIKNHLPLPSLHKKLFRQKTSLQFTKFKHLQLQQEKINQIKNCRRVEISDRWWRVVAISQEEEGRRRLHIGGGGLWLSARGRRKKEEGGCAVLNLGHSFDKTCSLLKCSK